MKVKVRRGPLTFALIALAFCAGIASILNHYFPDSTHPVSGTLVSNDCQTWKPQAQFHQEADARAIFYKDGTRISMLQAAGPTNVSVNLQAPGSPIVKEFTFAKLEGGFLYTFSSHTFGSLDLRTGNQVASSGSPGLNQAILQFSALGSQGEWTVSYDEPEKPTLTAKIKDLGTVICRSENCTFSIKENVLPLPLAEQKDVVDRLKTEGYFDKKLQPFRDACTLSREVPLRSAIEQSAAELRAQCKLEDFSQLPTPKIPDQICETLMNKTFPSLGKL